MKKEVWSYGRTWAFTVSRASMKAALTAYGNSTELINYSAKEEKKKETELRIYHFN